MVFKLDFVRVEPGKDRVEERLNYLILSTTPDNSRLEVIKDVEGFHIFPKEGDVKYIFNINHNQKVYSFGGSLQGTRVGLADEGGILYFYRSRFEQ